MVGALRAAVETLTAKMQTATMARTRLDKSVLGRGGVEPNPDQRLKQLCVRPECGCRTQDHVIQTHASVSLSSSTLF